MDNFSIVDGVILGILALSVLTGLVRGFVKELVALCVWIIAIWFGISYADTVGDYLRNYVHDDTARHAAGFVIILLVTVIAGSLFNAFLGFILKNTGLSGTDRLLGMLFGFVRGAFIVALIILAVRITDLIPAQDYINRSILYPRFTPLVDWMYDLSPDFVKNKGKKEADLHPSPDNDGKK